MRMSKGGIFGGALLVLTGAMGILAQDEYITKSEGSVWEAETLYVGAEIVTTGTGAVEIEMKNGHPRLTGTVYLMNPEKTGEAAAVVSNAKADYGKKVKVGTYEAGTKMVFMYVITDTTGYYAPLRGKKLYTGKNVEGVDEYVSEAEGMYGRRFAVAGRTKENEIEVGFDASGMGMFLDAVFLVRGAETHR